jgi:hypothetical protein
VDPIKPKLKLPGTKRLKLKCEGPLSIFAFKFNLRRYMEREEGDPLLMLKQKKKSKYQDTFVSGRGLPNGPNSVYRLGEKPIQSCGQSVSAPRGKARARLNARTKLRGRRQRSAREAKYRNRPIVPSFRFTSLADLTNVPFFSWHLSRLIPDPTIHVLQKC